MNRDGIRKLIWHHRKTQDGVWKKIIRDNIPFNKDIEAIARKTRAVCWGSLAQRNVVSRDTIYSFLDATPKDCMKIFDINLRQNFYTKEAIRASMKRCNVLKINDEELVLIGRMFGYPGLEPLKTRCLSYSNSCNQTDPKS